MATELENRLNQVEGVISGIHNWVIEQTFNNGKTEVLEVYNDHYPDIQSPFLEMDAAVRELSNLDPSEAVRKSELEIQFEDAYEQYRQQLFNYFSDFAQPERQYDTETGEPIFTDEELEFMDNLVDELVADISDEQLADSLNEEVQKNDSSVNEQVKDKFEESLDHNLVDPLTLDLDGDGIETVSVDQGVLFDHDGDGVRRGTGWINADDGLVVLDRNGNGLIDNGGELFGDHTIKADGSKALNGFDALGELDTNADGLIDVNDSQFADLRIWQDLNQDGISQANEMKTLSELNIESIGVESTPSNLDVGSGNVAIAEGSFTRTDGSTGNSGSAASLNLVGDTFHREFSDEIAIPDILQHLPDMQGSGAVRDLKQASALNSQLVSALEDYMAAPTLAEQIAIIDTIIAEWAETGDFQTFEERVANSGFDGKPVEFRIRDLSVPQSYVAIHV